MWEWTRSAYRPNPYQDDGRNQVDGAPPDLQRVVRGGSWYDRPFRHTSSFRLPCRQYQGVYNVDFRVVVEEQPRQSRTTANRKTLPRECRVRVRSAA